MIIVSIFIIKSSGFFFSNVIWFEKKLLISWLFSIEAGYFEIERKKILQNLGQYNCSIIQCLGFFLS